MYAFMLPWAVVAAFAESVPVMSHCEEKCVDCVDVESLQLIQTSLALKSVLTEPNGPEPILVSGLTPNSGASNPAAQTEAKQLEQALSKTMEQAEYAMKAMSAPNSDAANPPFPAAKAQQETARDLKARATLKTAEQPGSIGYAVEDALVRESNRVLHDPAATAKDRHEIVKVLDHAEELKDAVKKQLKPVGAPSDNAAQGPTGFSFKTPTFHIVFGLPHEAKATPISYTAAAAEYLAMTLFVVIGCGCAMAVCNEPGWVLQVSLTFGLAISALAYTVGHFSGGQINCAVTLGLVLAGKVTVAQGLLNFVAQMLGSITGAFILTQIIPEEQDKTGGLGTNSVNEKLSKLNAFVGEFFMTFLLMFVVFQTAINPETKENREMAALAIGFSVFLAHSVLINIDGCSINPTRTFGPALVRQLCYKNKAASFEEQWVFWAGPLLGAAGASLVSSLMR